MCAIETGESSQQSVYHFVFRLKKLFIYLILTKTYHRQLTNLFKLAMGQMNLIYHNKNKTDPLLNANCSEINISFLQSLI